MKTDNYRAKSSYRATGSNHVIIDNARCVLITCRLPAEQNIVPLVKSQRAPPALDMVAPIVKGNIVLVVYRRVAGMVARTPAEISSLLVLAVDKAEPILGEVT